MFAGGLTVPVRRCDNSVSGRLFDRARRRLWTFIHGLSTHGPHLWNSLRMCRKERPFSPLIEYEL